MEQEALQEEHWDNVIESRNSLFDLQLGEIWRYRDLLILFVRRDFVTVYKQTILGPLWFFIQPILTTITFTIIFNNVAGIKTGDVPSFLFNLAGIVVWNYFTSCLNETSDTFKKNAAVFGKVYFPRIIIPLSIVITNLVKLGIQFLIFVVFFIYHVANGMKVNLSWTILCYPLLVAVMGVLGLGLGMIISSMVTKYRDLTFLISFGVQLLMYVSAVMYPMALVKEKLPEFGWIIDYNPLAHLIESTRSILLGVGEFDVSGLLFTVLITIILFSFGLIIFNKTEKSFIDTV